MRVVMDEALDSYKENIVWELQSNNLEEMEANAEKISQWVQNFGNSMTE
jgi:hypothetical protein